MNTKEYIGIHTQNEINIEAERLSTPEAKLWFDVGANLIKHQSIPMLEEKDKEIDRLNKLIDGYKFVCELADVPQVLIDNPILAKPGKLTESDIKWAQEKIEEYEQSKNK